MKNITTLILLAALITACGARKKTTSKTVEYTAETTVSELKQLQTETATVLAVTNAERIEKTTSKTAAVSGTIANPDKPATATRMATGDSVVWTFENFQNVTTSDDQHTANAAEKETHRSKTITDKTSDFENTEKTDKTSDFENAEMDLDRKAPSSLLFFGAVVLILLIIILDHLRRNRK